MQFFRFMFLTSTVIAMTVLNVSPTVADEFTQAQLDFFESKIRPVLAEHCLECHGPDSSENGLRLDTRELILRGGDSGPAARPGDESSILVTAVNHTGDYEMPPAGKLDDAIIQDLTSWVKMGLPWPKTSAPITELSSAELLKRHRKSHWAFQPIETPAIPKTKLKHSTELDQLIAAKLEKRGMTMSPVADKKTLIRRAYFDLTGLPPTFEEVQSFLNDNRPEAYSELIDRLLESPHYGERWARHWLDVARYSDTSGYAFNKGDRNYPFAFTYRDYVIRAFNEDLPYDQFIREQLAADHLEIPKDKSSLAALGFITVGRKFIQQSDTLDDQVDVVTRGLMGLTVSCARCHDHKYDAIPTADYYSIFSVFENNQQPKELPLIGNPEEVSQFKKFFDTRNNLKQNITRYQNQKRNEILEHVRSNYADYLVRISPAVNGETLKKSDYEFLKLDAGEIRMQITRQWRDYLAKKVPSSPQLLKPVLELLAIPDKAFAEETKRRVSDWNKRPNQSGLNRLLLEELSKKLPSSKIEVSLALARVFERVTKKWQESGAKQPPVQQFKSGAERHVAQILFGANSPANFKVEDIRKFVSQSERKKLGQLQDEVSNHDLKSPDGIRRAMVVEDRPKLRNTHIHIRGNQNNKGDQVPRQFVAILSPDPENRTPFKKGSGRLELANHIANPQNPLTARVFVNRVWMHHFSSPIVDTPSDFGIRCEEPLQRDVLDYLARKFMDEGWSIKNLHRTIMLSDTYRQSSQDRTDYLTQDPENRLVWKMNRRRLEFEPLRDSMLVFGGNLDQALYGKAVDLFKRPFATKRTIYGKIDRQDLPNLLRVFDLASPDQSAAKRTRTTVPQQALYLMNSPFVIHQVQAGIKSIPEFSKNGGNRQQRISAIYHKLFQRDPTEQELQIGCEFVENAIPKEGEINLGVWQRYIQVLLCSNEFEFID